jgi:hypothetical protein
VRGHSVWCVALVCACCGAAGADESGGPGLGEIMSANQMRHVKLWFAGEAGNWPLASYEVDELTGADRSAACTTSRRDRGARQTTIRSCVRCADRFVQRLSPGDALRL